MIHKTYGITARVTDVKAFWLVQKILLDTKLDGRVRVDAEQEAWDSLTGTFKVTGQVNSFELPFGLSSLMLKLLPFLQIKGAILELDGSNPIDWTGTRPRYGKTRVQIEVSGDRGLLDPGLVEIELATNFITRLVSKLSISFTGVEEAPPVV